MTDEEAAALLNAPRVRIWDAMHSQVFAEGRPIAICYGPSITIEDDNGIRHHHALSLPVEVEHREWRTA